MVEGDAQPANVRIAWWEEPLAQIRQGAIGAHEVKGVFREVVVYSFVAELRADQKQLYFSMGGRARRFSSDDALRCQPLVKRRITVPVFHILCETDVVVGSPSTPADVYVAGTDQVVEDL